MTLIYESEQAYDQTLKIKCVELHSKALHDLASLPTLLASPQPLSQVENRHHKCPHPKHLPTLDEQAESIRYYNNFGAEKVVK